MPVGRYAPSPTGRLHLGNLRTALVAWLFARVDDSRFRVRFDDLGSSAVRPEYYDQQLTDLAAIGLDWDGEVVRQSDRLDRYQPLVRALADHDLTYPCWCSRREIREAAQAPNGALAGYHYPATCRHLDPAARQRKAADAETQRRHPAHRLRTDPTPVCFDDLVAGQFSTPIDDFVVSRGDGTPAYHLVNLVDDHDMGIEVVVRGDDLLDSTSRQIVLADALARAGTKVSLPQWAHVPLVLAPSGERLAKRHGAVTLEDWQNLGWRPETVVGFLAWSIGLAPGGFQPGTHRLTPQELVEGLTLERLVERLASNPQPFTLQPPPVR